MDECVRYFRINNGFRWEIKLRPNGVKTCIAKQG